MRRAEVVYAVAHIGPATSREIAEFGGEPNNHRSNVRDVVKGAYDKGLLVRRKRPDNDPGGTPYEYELAPWDSGSLVDTRWCKSDSKIVKA